MLSIHSCCMQRTIYIRSTYLLVVHKHGRLSTLLFSTNINQLGRNKNIIEPTIHLSYQRIDISRVPPVSPFQHLDVHHARGISLPNHPIIVSKVRLFQAYKKRKGNCYRRSHQPQVAQTNNAPCCFFDGLCGSQIMHF